MNKYISALLLLSISVISLADDTDIISQEIPKNSNVLFIMDMSKSMDWGDTDGVFPSDPADSRKNILQTALSLVLTDPTLTGINVGISSFAGNPDIGTQNASGIAYPVSPIDADAQTQLSLNPLFSHPGTSYLPVGGGRKSRSYIGDAVPTTWSPHGGTPIVDALYEAALYFRGLDVHWGRQDPSDVRSAHPSTYTGLIQNTASSTTSYQCNIVSCSGASCNATSTCVTNPQVNTCSTPTCGTSCTFHTSSSCTTTCPDNVYTESGTCANPVTNCTPFDYYQCLGDDVTSCTHEVCGNVTINTSSPEGTAVYKSPISSECANNSIVLLTDGSPTVNNSSSLVSDLIGSTYNNNCSASGGDGRCGNELVKFLANEDNASTISGEQNVVTHTIGLSLNDPDAASYLQGLATNGKGQFVTANSTASLSAALKDTITYTARARTFTSPTYTTTNAASLSHNDNVYIPVFDRGVGPVWSGNLKKYHRQGGDLKDADGNNAIGPFGALKNEARDHWSTVASTQAVKSGGAANKIDPVKRANGTTPVYTDNGALGTGANLIPLTNGLANELFAKAPITVNGIYKNKLVDFILGKKPDGSARHHMGDIIHSKPVHASYGGNKVLFVGTNEGYLHAFDENTGEELFAFMPRELLKNIDVQYRNDALDKHVYGVDGPMTLWHDDIDNDNIIDSGETAILYFGLRRGGKSYFALDVSNRLNPELKWRIKNTGQYSNLGFTWSQPSIAKMKYGGSSSLKPVLVLGGGYIDDDGVLGTAETDGNTATGSEVYIVDALTGAKIWKISDSSVVPGDAKKYAKPAKVRVIDINRDGSLDRLYYSDTGGNIWRVDFNSSTLSEAKVRHLAKLGGSPTTGRKFFTEPDVALFKRGGKYLASVSIGSGERPKPLGDARDDHFFVIFDDTIVTTPTTPPAIITIGDLMDATSGPVNPFSANKDGWYIDLTQLNAEKVLSTSMTFESMVFFSSFGATSNNANVCDISNVNQTRLYALDLLSGAPALDFDGNGTPEMSQPGPSGEIPGQVQIIVKPPSGTGGSCVHGDCVRPKEAVLGTDKTVPLPRLNELQRVYWIDED